ncbi:MAG: hypothetical protein HYT41_01275 [Candidatus Sungbacteria bacterium]|nr:hypothetical protein [Candidatus Sungbacteria bacterium]
MEASGPTALVETLKRNCLSPESLTLKEDATVMCTKNNPQLGFVNGTLGRVIGFDKESGYPVIETHKGTEILIKPMEWIVEEGGRIRARVAQIPLRLAWAMTVHKSQGMSMDAAIVDLSDAFEYGQGYVALSRVRRLSGLYLIGANDRAFMVSHEILEKDRWFRMASEKAEAKLRGMPREEIGAKHKAFVERCGGHAGDTGSADTASPRSARPRRDRESLERIRAAHPNAYRAWSPEEDEALRRYFKEGWTMVALADHFGRKSGAVRSRLIKAGLIVFNPDAWRYESKSQE